MFRWLWLFGPVVLAGLGCAKLNSDFADTGGGGGDATTAGLSSTSGAAGSDTQSSAEGGQSTTMRGTTEPGTTYGDSTEGHEDSTAGHEDGTAGEDDGSTTDPTIGSTVGTDGSTGDPFVCPVVNEPCDAFAEESCGTGECRPYGFDGEFAGVACVEQPPAAQPLAIGEKCSHTCPDFWGEDACPPRSICDPFSDSPTCVPLCGGSVPDFDCDEGMACEVYDVPGGSFGICGPECGLLEQDCPDGQTCLPDPINGLPTCLPAASEGQQGAYCEFINDCAAGFVCLDNDFVQCDSLVGCCTALCEVDEDECPGSLVCNPYAAGAGACQDPG